MEKLKGAIRMFGGKGNMTNQITKYFPENGTYDTYIEPFSATYSVGLSLLTPPPIEIYNDLEKNVYSLYKVLSDKILFEEFKEKCDLVFYNEDIRKEFKEKLTKDEMSIVERAFYFFYVNRTSHNGMVGFLKTYMYEEI